jgi:outer membrane protein OmpA-like peptidoglycan-associated protein
MSKHIIVLISLLAFAFSGKAQPNTSSIFEGSLFEVNKLNINTPTSDFGPSFVADDLWFSAYSDRDINKKLRDVNSKVFYKLYKSETDVNGKFTTFDREVISDFDSGFHEGPVSYCEKTGELFLTLSNSINVDVEVDGLILKKKKMRLRLVTAQKKDDKWVIVQEMPFNDPVYSVGHPSVSVTGDTLFFTSDVPSTIIGKTDIYMVVRKNNTWGKPVNLGNKINTTGDEMFPFYMPGGVLVFASNGHTKSSGGLDLYYSKLSENGFSDAEPISQLNTIYDDFGLIIHQNERYGYFVSNRPGQAGDDDIYQFEIKQLLVTITGVVVDDANASPIANAIVELIDCDDNQSKSAVSDENGKFKFEGNKKGYYKVKASKFNYSGDLKDVDSSNRAELRLKQNKLLEVTVLDYDTRIPVSNAIVGIGTNAPEKLKSDGLFSLKLMSEGFVTLMAKADGYLNQSRKIDTSKPGITRDTIFMMKKELNKTFVLDNIYYNLDKWDILPNSEIELNKLVKILIENPTIKVELGSHTDSRGSDSYNMSLSQKRSDSAVAFIVKNGVPKSKITAKGYGETKLVNKCVNGVICSDDEHRKNRRTEFKIIGFTK